MKQLFYLYESGVLQRKDDSLVLNTKSKSAYYLPIEQISMIMCFADIILNKRVLSLLNKYEVPIVFFNYYGNCIGRFIPKKNMYRKVIVEQVTFYNDVDKRLYVAKAFTKGYIKNMVSLANYYQKKNKVSNDKIDIMRQFVYEVKDCSSIDQLLLLEAKCKQVYYSVFDDILGNTTFKFVSRTKHPPKNEVNAMMSYGYSLLYEIVLIEIEKTSLLSQISFIHSISRSTESLQYDIADIFKPMIVDRLMLRLIRKRQITLEHFEYKDNGTCFLNKEGLKVFSVAFDNQLKKVITHNKRHLSYRSLIRAEIYNLKKYISSASKNYKTIVMKW